MVNYEEISNGYGKCMRIYNEYAELIVSLSFGPRVLSYSIPGHENMFYEDKGEFFKEDSAALKEVFGKDAYWKIYGGHRMWFACEDITTYCPDNDPVTYEFTEKGIKFIQKEMPVLKFTRSIEIIMEPNSSKVTLIHRALNNGEKRKTAIWALTVTDKGGIEIFEPNSNDAGWLYNRNMTIWHYTDLSDRERLDFMKKYIIFSQVCKEGKMKIGLNLDKGYSLLFNKGCVFVKTFKTSPSLPYADNNCSFETYTDSHILEIESLSPLYEVDTGEEISHTETWHLLIDDHIGDIFKNEIETHGFICYLKSRGIL